MKRTLLIFYCLMTYALAELVWWGFVLVKSQPARVGMIMGELSVFSFVLLAGAYHLQKSMNKERKLVQRQKNFLMSVTHELKSPLASIKLYLQTMQKRQLDHAQQISFIEKCLLDIERLDVLVENMLMATKLDGKTYTMPKEKLNLSILVDNVVNRLQINKCDYNLQAINPELEPNIEVSGDKFALTSVVTNLIENALKYSPPCQVVSVKLYKKDTSVRLLVADHGIGIADAEKPLIFDKFYRVGSEDTRNTKGTGLGLYIVKQVLEMHGAHINVRDNKPKGTVFEVVFN
jgi:two-component system phosphate regulon sensor histidine kinase PhoR